jgi:hypothetical protein
MDRKGAQGEFDDILIEQRQLRTKLLAGELDKRLKGVALGIDRHRLALINDKSYSYISEILNTNSEETQKPFQVKLIPSLIIEAPDRLMTEVVGWICDLAGYAAPEKKRVMSTEEELMIIKKKIALHGLQAIFGRMDR